MLKCMFYILIVLGCGGIGLFKAYEFKERVVLLEEVIKMLQILKIELIYRKDPLPRLLSKIGNLKDNSAFFLCTTVSMKYEQLRNNSFFECWTSSLDDIYKNTSLKDEELQIMKDLGITLGTSSIRDQNNILEATIYELERILEEAKLEKKTKGKMFTSLGFIIGITIVILII